MSESESENWLQVFDERRNYGVMISRNDERKMIASHIRPERLAVLCCHVSENAVNGSLSRRVIQRM